MNTFDITLGNVNIVITGNSDEEIAETLVANGFGELLHNNFYFSRTQQQRTGEGWVRLSSMNEKFIINAFVARLSESVKSIYQSSQNSDNALVDMYFTAFLQSLVDSLEYASLLPDEHNNQPILQGLVNELDRRYTEAPSNDGFDEDNEDVVSSDNDSRSFTSINDGYSLSFYDQA